MIPTGTVQARDRDGQIDALPHGHLRIEQAGARLRHGVAGFVLDVDRQANAGIVPCAQPPPLDAVIPGADLASDGLAAADLILLFSFFAVGPAAARAGVPIFSP